MKKSTAIIIAIMVVVIVSLAVVSVVSLVSGDKNDETTTAAELKTDATTEQMTVMPAGDIVINPDSFTKKVTGEGETSEETETEAVEEKKEADGDYLSTLSDNDIKMLNIFLSNFSEAYVENIDTSDMEAMIEFVCLNTKINYSEKITYDGVIVENPRHEGWDCHGWVTEEYVAERVDRFFGVELENTSTDSYVYQDGKYYYLNADGETYASFTKVTSASENSDGTVTVEYDVYWYDVAHDSPADYVYEGIGAENHDELCKYNYSGTAVVRPVHLGGEGYANYKLVSLERN